ncbi:response regulator [Leptolyngbya sp. AN10]|uniref:response regulator n=1 Tax=Leptolyngbya sp. AN10 TaxID=3423365 RepID=UPI003D32460C
MSELNQMDKILIIDNEATTRDVILEVLTLGNFDAITAASGQQGIRSAQKYLPSLILCDIMMPDLDGYEVLDALRQEPSTATIPFIFLTARSLRSDQRQGMELGADDYLTKPFTGAELLSAVTTQLDKRARIQHRTVEQSSEISNLQQQVRELYMLSEHKEKLLDNLSQGLRAPLTNIQMALKMLEGGSNEQQERYLEVLKKECSREIALVNQVTEMRDVLTPESLRLLKKLDLLK